MYQKGFGYRDLKSKEAVIPQTIFGTASVTKSFTAMAILDLEAEEKHQPLRFYFHQDKDKAFAVLFSMRLLLQA
ncbi:serine hydrolase [Pullulanibacillus camelliae]|uniref:serine hydrolase n=1 Tax=Pullulanibacillus camelliae TaxID=1707096 RepID=UPI0016653573